MLDPQMLRVFAVIWPVIPLLTHQILNQEQSAQSSFGVNHEGLNCYTGVE